MRSKETFMIFITIIALQTASCGCHVVEPQKISPSLNQASLWSGVQNGDDDQSRLNSAIKKLWSPIENERQQGMEQIKQLGDRGIEPLLALLTDLSHNNKPQFLTGNEEEGERLLKEYRNNPENDKVARRIAAITINERLKSDIVNLLGDLRAEKAVPILVEIVNKNLLGMDKSEIYALRCIGKTAIPELIKDLDESYIRSRGCGMDFYKWTTEYLDAEVEDKDFDEDKLTTEQINSVRQKVIGILAMIPDPRSLPALESLLNTTQDDSLIQSVKLARSVIQQELSRTSGPDRLQPAPLRRPIH